MKNFDSITFYYRNSRFHSSNSTDLSDMFPLIWSALAYKGYKRITYYNLLNERVTAFYDKYNNIIVHLYRKY